MEAVGGVWENFSSGIELVLRGVYNRQINISETKVKQKINNTVLFSCHQVNKKKEQNTAAEARRKAGLEE